MSPRRGAALVLALILLAALLLLGLPFLFSQSASLSGTRSFSYSRLAQIGRDSAENLATAVAAYAMEPALRAARPGKNPAVVDPSWQWSSLSGTYGGGERGPRLDLLTGAYSATPPLPAAVVAVPGPGGNDGSVALDAAMLVDANQVSLGFNVPPAPGDRQRTFIGAAISDESGKLDPNDMGPELWDALLKAVGIPDWDDNDVDDPALVACDDDSIGQLANKLAGLRMSLPTHRITDLEQLLIPDPQEGGTRLELRHRLTRAELERLRPHLTLHNPRQGRDGLIDLGSVAKLDPYGGRTTYWMDCRIDDRHPLMTLGTLLMGENRPVAGGPHALAEVNAVVEVGGAKTVVMGRSLMPSVTSTGAGFVDEALGAEGQAVALEAPAPLNVHHLTDAVRQTLAGDPARPVSGPPTLVKPTAIVRTIGADPGASPPNGGLSTVVSAAGSANFLPWLDPVASGYEMPPVGILSGGSFTIDAAATVTDGLGRQAAQEMRRDVIQAVPQEYLLERRWITQGAIEALIEGRYGSQMQSWPIAAERLAQMVAPSAPLTKAAPDDHDLASEALAQVPGAPASGPAANSAATGLSARPLPDPAVLPTQLDPQYPEHLFRQQVAIDWRVCFGAERPVDDAHVLAAEVAPFGPPPPLQQQTFAMPPTLTPPGGAMLLPDAPDAAGTPAVVRDGLRPDGFFHRATDDLSYPINGRGLAANPDQSGFIIARPADATTNVNEMGARQFSLWIRPEDNWDTGHALVPIFEVRTPKANLAGVLQISGAVVSNDCENYLGFFYDAKHEMLVLALAPPSIERTPLAGASADYNVNPAYGVPDDLFGSGAAPAQTPTLDERSLAASGAPALAPDPYGVDPYGANGLASFTDVFARNRVLHCFKTPARNAMPFFRAGEWHHLQVAIASDRPDGVTIMVDGTVGTDFAKKAVANGGSTALDTFGDHVALPALVLKDPLPYVLVQSGSNPGPLTNGATAEITLLVPDGLSVQSLLPIRGMVRIDDEYIAYSGINGNKLENIRRGQRQDTFSTSTRVAQQFPNLQAHASGALVVPGGYRLQFPNSGGRLYRGGCVLAQTFTNGDPAVAGLHPWQVWGRLNAAGLTASGGNSTLSATTSTISLQAGLGVVTQFPKPGIVQISGHYFGYTDVAGNTLTGVTNLSTWPAAVPQFAPPPPAGDLVFPTASPPDAIVISMAVSGADPTAAGLYEQSNTGESILSLQDGFGRVEWVRYTRAITSADGHSFFINDLGFRGTLGTDTNRGVCRTAWVGHPADLPAMGNPTPDVAVFAPATTQVLPVQTEAGNAGHLIATGDVLTLMPHALASASLPVQLVVRYAACDGFPAAPQPLVPDPLMDAKNQYFSFSTALPAQLADLAYKDYDFLCGDCWTGADLTPMFDNSTGGPSRVGMPRGHLPRLDEWSAGFGLGGSLNGSVWFGNTSPDGPNPRLGVDCSFDVISAGGLTHLGSGVDGHELPNSIAALHGIERFWIKNPADASKDIESLSLITASSDMATAVVQATTPLFLASQLGPGSPPNTGLVVIDGEVFAYRALTQAEALRVVNGLTTMLATPGYDGSTWPFTVDLNGVQTSGYFARLIGRALLGSRESDHVIDSTPGDGPYVTTGGGQGSDPATDPPGPPAKLRPLRPVLTATRLPLGPVLQVATDIQDQQWFTLTDGTFDANGNAKAAILYAPAALVCSPGWGAAGIPAAPMEMLQLVGPKVHHGVDQRPPPLGYGADPDANRYSTAPWLRGLYNTARQNWTGGWSEEAAVPIVIGWWPRYPSALPRATAGTPLLPQHYRSRTYAWVGFPFSLYGAYYDPDRLPLLPAPDNDQPLAQIDLDPDSYFTDGAGDYFAVEARALSYADAWSTGASGTGVMDWSLQGGVPLSPSSPISWTITRGTLPPLHGVSCDASAAFSTAKDTARCFHDGSGKARPVDGAELRVLWSYAQAPSGPPFADLADATDRTLTIRAARLRCLAPVRVLATEHAR
jgi:hypothetical protein